MATKFRQLFLFPECSLCTIALRPWRCLHVCMHVYKYTLLNFYCTQLYLNTHTYPLTHTLTHTHTHTHICTWVCTELGFSCNDGDVRLVGGDNQYGGRVEYCFDNSFGTICDDTTWDDNDAQVVCNQLGFTSTPSGVAYIHYQ